MIRGFIGCATPSICAQRRRSREGPVRSAAAAAGAATIAIALLDRAREIRELRRRELGETFDLLAGLLARLLPGWTWRRPEGGVSLWVRLPLGSASEFAALAGGHGVAIVPGPVMSARGAFDDHLRLPLAREVRPVSSRSLRWSSWW